MNAVDPASIDWTPVCVLPNAWLENEIGFELAALAPPDDPRVLALKQAYPTFESFLSRFTDNFGQKFEPAVLLLNKDAPPSYREVKAVSSFRNLIALSVITYSRARRLMKADATGVFYGEAFSIYPWMLDRDDKNLVGSTPAMLGLHEVSKFHGQSSPAIFRTPIGETDIDEPLLAELITRWSRYYDGKDAKWEDRALMRLLNMAYNAALLPAGAEKTFLDEGRIIALWVSAFEILAHPGKKGQVKMKDVFALIEGTTWVSEGIKLETEPNGKNNYEAKHTLPSRLYKTLYKCRNEFLHGSPVERSKLILPGSEGRISEYAAPLYRIALTSFLKLVYPEEAPADEEPTALGAYIASRISFEEPQELAEQALLTAVGDHLTACGVER